jgi:adenylate cyclase
MSARVEDWTVRFGDLAADPGDGRTTRLRKSLLLGGVLVLIPLVLPWSILYFYLGYPLAGAMPGFYFVFSVFSVIYFLRTRNRDFLRTSQYVFVLLLPFALTLVLGGFHNSSAVIIWCVISPIAALVIDGWENARSWFALYIVLLILAAGLEPILPEVEPLAESMIRFFYVLNIGTVTTAVFALLFLFIREGWDAYQQLGREREKSDSLLLNVLPKEVVSQLRDGPRTVAQYYDQASVLFADAVGFTPLAAGSSPQILLELLNEIFTHFDNLASRHGLEKISTIGDSYMVASGVPVKRDDHAQAIAAMALDMNAYVAGLATPTGEPLLFRIGINSGPLVAGVIGCTKFHYDIWGDTVNTASRMESQGVPGKIQISERTYHLISDEFCCTRRGVIEIKGKGPMPTWFLDGRETKTR